MEDICILYQCPPNSKHQQKRCFNNQVEKIAHSIGCQSASLDFAPTVEISSGYSRRGKLMTSEQHGLPFYQLLSTQLENNRLTLSSNTARFLRKPDILRQVDYFLSHFLHERVIKFFSLEKTLILNTDLQS